MTTKQIPIWIDCDTGTDDTVAIMLAHALPELSVIGLSAVAGNSPLYNTFPNTRRVVHLLGADYPVYPGAERPLKRPGDFAQFMGSPVLLKTYKPVNGRKEFAGKLAGYEDGAVLLDMGGAEPVRFEKNEVALVRLRVEF